MKRQYRKWTLPLLRSIVARQQTERTKDIAASLGMSVRGLQNALARNGFSGAQRNMPLIGREWASLGRARTPDERIARECMLLQAFTIRRETAATWKAIAATVGWPLGWEQLCVAVMRYQRRLGEGGRPKAARRACAS